jgi:hypothetical protein
MDPAMHKELNIGFQNAFGWPVRNGISTTPYVQQAETYGTVGYFFPPNGYKFVYSLKIADLWQEVKKFLFPVFDEKQKFLGFDWMDNGNPILPFQFMEKYYTDKNLKDAILKSKGEIMFNVPHYYLLLYGNIYSNFSPSKEFLESLNLNPKVKYY